MNSLTLSHTHEIDCAKEDANIIVNKCLLIKTIIG